jgi:hypothetical protein
MTLMYPAARTQKLTIQELTDETLVFDHETGKAHCLNRTAALVWNHCDGQTSPAELSRRLGVAEAAVELALEQLQRRGLLDSSVLPMSPGRRDALRKLVAAAALLPAIMTITAPAAMAQTSPQCTNDGQCSSLNSNGGCVLGRCISGQCVAQTQPDTTTCTDCSEPPCICFGGACVAP